MARDLERYFDELEHRVAMLESELEYERNRFQYRLERLEVSHRSRVQPSKSLRELLEPEQYAAFHDEGIGSSCYSIPISDMGRDDLIAVIGHLGKELQKRAIWSHLHRS